MAIDRRIRASLISVSADIILIAIKSTLAFFTGSLALLADAYHSASDLVVSLMVLSGVMLRRRREKLEGLPGIHDSENVPPTIQSEKAEGDIEEAEKVPGKKPGYWIESVVAYFVSLVILYVAYDITSRIGESSSKGMENTWIAVIGISVCIGIAYFISTFKIIVGKDCDSPALVADGYHSRTDMFTSIAVLFSILGQWIGIDIDTIVALVIAVLIGVTGLELFVSSIVSFAKKTDVKQAIVWQALFSRMDRLTGSLGERMFGRRISLAPAAHYCAEAVKWTFKPKHIGIALMLALCAYFLYGWTTIKPGEKGVHFRFGAIIDDSLDPGFHYILPWPFEKLVKVNEQRIFRVELGFRTDSTLRGNISPPLWETRHVRQGYKKMKEESIVITGDENMLDMSLVIHYRPKDTVQHLFRINNVHDMLRGIAESEMREIISTESEGKIVAERRRIVLDRIHAKIGETSEKLGLGLEIIDIHCHDLHPPLDVVPAFRDVFSAREDQAKLLNEAKTYRNETIPKAKADIEKRLKEAEIYAYEKKSHAKGEAERFVKIAEAYKKHPDVNSYHLYLKAMEAGLAGRKKIIADPEVNRGGYRLWLFSPGKTPFSNSSEAKQGK